jgi:ribonuclease HI
MAGPQSKRCAPDISQQRAEMLWAMREDVEERMDMRRQERNGVEDMGTSVQTWVADDMSIKTSSTGVRVATLNTNRKFMADNANRQIILDLMISMRIDIMVLTEPGKTDEMSIAGLKGWAIQQGMSAEVVNRSNSMTAGGIVVLTAQSWAGVKRTVTTFKPEKAERDRVFAIEYDNLVEGDHNKMLLIGYYGYNASHLKKAEVREMHNFVWKMKRAFKRKCWRAPVVVAGDINAAVSSRYDTDRQGVSEYDEREEDAGTVEHLETLGFHDPLRDNNPDMRIVTRKKGDNTERADTMRYLDKILMTAELSNHENTRVGVYQPAIFGVDDTDHKMVVADLPIDVAGLATDRAEIWDVHKKTTQRWDSDEMGNMAKEKVQQFNEKASEMTPPPGTGADGVIKWLIEAGKNTVLKACTQEYPRAVRKLKDFMTTDWLMRQNAKFIRECLRRVGQYEHPDAALARLSKLKNVTETPHATIQQQYTLRAGQGREEIEAMLKETLRITKEYVSREARKSRAEQIKENIKRRNDRFADRHKKSLKKVITSIMRRARVNEQITSQKRADAPGIATSAKEVAKEVIKFYKNWMKSRVACSERWKSWSGMMNLETDDLVDPNDKEFVECAYRESFDKFNAMQQEEGMWDRVWAEIHLPAVKEALLKFKGGKAGGPSGTTYDLLKAMDDENLGPIVTLMRQCLKERRLPKALNRSMLRALPKTEGGLADLNLTRPIALMEALGKLFERILFIRIVDVMADKEMIDLSQHGGMAKRSTADPLRTFAEVMEDAEDSGSEFHLFSADLSKAFDTLEYWSQAMSWRALGMPQEMTEMLMNMDKEGESEVILGQGRTTSDVLGNEGWFTSGRGVRQGSIGGPIKWIVYMNFWLKYVNSKHKGEGYKMSQGGDGEVTLLSQMFVDDSNWAASTLQGMERIIGSCSTFVEFHGLEFNKKKSEYIVMNQKMNQDGDWRRPTWPTGEEIVETIRVVGCQEPRRKEEHLAWGDKANKALHGAIYKLSPEAIKSQPQAEWLSIQSGLETAASKWAGELREQWSSKGIMVGGGEALTEAIASCRGRETWRSMEQNGPYEAEKEAEGIAAEWQEAKMREIRLEVRQGAVRYLGVWFEAGGEWKKQRQVLAATFKDTNDRISRSCPTREQAIYCINATINAALKFPLQLAWVPNTVLEEWDRKNRKVVRTMGFLPVATPVALMHLPRKEGGLGLESLRQAVGRVQIARYITLLNTGNDSLAANMTRAGRERLHKMGGGRHSIHRKIHDELTAREMGITEAQIGQERVYMWHEDQHCIDTETADEREETGRDWEAYGDGATYERENRAGWGVWMDDGQVQRQSEARLAGEQSNDGAEARAVLEAMLMVNPHDNISIYCDNSGCVSKWGKLQEGVNPLTWGYRAIWLRIHRMVCERKSRGSKTTIQWVHSHVDDEERARNTKSKLTCACREDGQEVCDPEHRHHKGNAEADTRAGAGAKEEGADDVVEATRGEMWFVLQGVGGFAQGNYAAWLRKREEETMSHTRETSEPEEEGTGEAGEAIPRWAEATRASDRRVMRATMKTLDTKDMPTWRFWSRVLCKTLPTHAQMMMFAGSSEENTYRTVYHGHIGEEGMCVRCGESKETVQHALWDCPAAEQAWESVHAGLCHEWGRWGLDWEGYDWVSHPEIWGTWDRMWGVAGLVPKGVFDRMTQEAGIGEIGAFTLLRDTAMTLLKGSHGAWQARIEGTLLWEKENEGLREAKKLAKKTVWARGAVRAKKPRHVTQSTERKKRKGELRNALKQKAIQRERERTLQENCRRYESGEAPMSITQSEKRATEAGNQALLEFDGTQRQVRAQQAAAGENVGEMQTVQTKASSDQQHAKLSGISRDPAQRGIWFPAPATKVATFSGHPASDAARAEAQGKVREGIVRQLHWGQGCRPKFRVRYSDGTEEWHDVMRDAGTRIRQADGRVTQRPVPHLVMSRAGHGSEMEVEWVVRKAETWYQGVIVALDSERGVAIRYTTAAGPSVAWHTQEDLDQRGHVITTLRESGEFTNAQYQETGPNRVRGCLLLTDEGKCECAVCKEVGWPEEIRAAEATGVQVEGLAEMSPADGRLLLQERRDSQQLTDRGRRKRAKMQQHRAHEAVTVGRAQRLRDRNAQKERENQKEAEKQLAQSSGPLAAESTNVTNPERDVRPGEHTTHALKRAPVMPKRAGSPLERDSSNGACDSGDVQQSWEDGSGGDDLDPGEEGSPRPKRSGPDPRDTAKARAGSDQEQSAAEADRRRQRRKGVGLARARGREEADHTEAEDGVDEHVDKQPRTQDQRPEGRCSLGNVRGTEGAEDEGSRQRGSDGVDQHVDAAERGASEGGVPNPSDGKERSNEDGQEAPLLQIGRGGGDVCGTGTHDREGGVDAGTGQGFEREERVSRLVDCGVPEMGRGQGVAVTGGGGPGGSDTADGARAAQDARAMETEGGGRPAQNTRRRRRLGLHRDSGVPNARGLLYDRPGQSRVPGTGGDAWGHHQSAEPGPLLDGQVECTEEGGETSNEATRILCDGLAVPRVQNPDNSELHERIEGMHEWEAAAGPEERDESTDARPQEGRAETVQPGYKEPDAGTGGGERCSALCHGESAEQRPVGHGGGEVETDKARAAVEANKSGPVCVRQEVPETDKDHDEHTGMGAQRGHRPRQMQAATVRGYGGEHTGSRPREARATNDNNGPSKKAKGREDNREGRKTGVLGESREEPGSSRACAGNSASSPGVQTRTRAKAKAHRQQIDKEWKDTREPKRRQEVTEREKRPEGSEATRQKAKAHRQQQDNEWRDERDPKRRKRDDETTEGDKQEPRDMDRQSSKAASQNDNRSVSRLRTGVG